MLTAGGVCSWEATTALMVRRILPISAAPRFRKLIAPRFPSVAVTPGEQFDLLGVWPSGVDDLVQCVRFVRVATLLAFYNGIRSQRWRGGGETTALTYQDELVTVPRPVACRLPFLYPDHR